MISKLLPLSWEVKLMATRRRLGSSRIRDASVKGLLAIGGVPSLIAVKRRL
jgi:hypothetical protein